MMGPETFNLFLGVAMLAVFALTTGGIVLLRAHRDKPRAFLMLAAAFVLFANVLIWTV